MCHYNDVATGDMKHYSAKPSAHCNSYSYVADLEAKPATLLLLAGL